MTDFKIVKPCDFIEYTLKSTKYQTNMFSIKKTLPSGDDI